MKRKTVVMIQGLVSLVLTVLMAIMALLPIFKMTVYPTDDACVAVSEIATLSAVARAGESASEEELANTAKQYEEYLKKLAESTEPEREPTEEERQKLIEFNMQGSEINAKISALNLMKKQLQQSNLDETEKSALQKEIEKAEEEIKEDCKSVTYYELPYGNKGYRLTFSPLDFITGFKSVQLLSFTMNRNSFVQDLASASTPADAERIQKNIDSQQEWLDDHKDYYKSVTQKSLDTALFLAGLTGNFRASADDEISKNDLPGLYELAFTDKVLEGEQTPQAMFAVFQMIFTCAFTVWAVVVAIVTAIGVLTSIKNKHKLYSRSIGGFRHMTIASLALFIALACSQNAALAAGGAIFVVFLTLGNLMNGLFARTLPKSKEEEIYLDLAQGWGLLAFIGLLISAVTLGAKGFFRSFYSRAALFSLAKKSGVRAASGTAGISFIFLILFMLVFFLVYFVLLRLSLNEKSKLGKNTQAENNAQTERKKTVRIYNYPLFVAVFTGLTAVLIIVFGAAFSLGLGKLAGCLAGLLLTFASSVAYLVLLKKFCKGLDPSARAHLNMQAVPDENEDSENKICIPVIGSLLRKDGKAETADFEADAEPTAAAEDDPKE